MFCPECGTKNADDARFCESCGFALPGMDVTDPAEDEPAGYGGQSAGYGNDSAYGGSDGYYGGTGGYTGGSNGYISGSNGYSGGTDSGKDGGMDPIPPKKLPIIPIVIGAAALLIAVVVLVFLTRKPGSRPEETAVQTTAATTAADNKADKKESKAAKEPAAETTAQQTLPAQTEQTSAEALEPYTDYATGIAEIPEETIRQMNDKAVSDFKLYMNETWVLVRNAEGRQERLNSMTYVGSLFLTAKQTSLSPQNHCVLIFEQSISNTNVGGIVYYYTMYSDLYVNADGTCSVDLSKTTVPVSSREQVGNTYQYSGEYTIINGDSYYYYDGYSSIADLKAHFVSTFGGNYNIEECLN